jgi:hypothetical protein
MSTANKDPQARSRHANDTGENIAVRDLVQRTVHITPRLMRTFALIALST